MEIDQNGFVTELATIAARDGFVICYRARMLRAFPTDYIPHGWTKFPIRVKPSNTNPSTRRQA